MEFISHIRHLAFQLGLLAILPGLAWPQNPCDLNKDGTVNFVDVALATNMAVGLFPCTADIAGFGVCNVIVVQRVTNAAMGGTCVTGPVVYPHSVSLSWTASTSLNVTGYNVYRGTTSGGPYTKLNSSPRAEITYEDLSVQAGTTYYYVATAVDSSNNESAYSNQASAVVPSP